QLNAINIEDILAGLYPSGAMLATPADFTLDSSDFTLDPTLFSKMFVNPFAEPGPDLWDVALGQYYDPDTGTLSAFIDAYQGVPEPSTALLFGSSLTLFALWRRRRDRKFN